MEETQPGEERLSSSQSRTGRRVSPSRCHPHLGQSDPVFPWLDQYAAPSDQAYTLLNLFESPRLFAAKVRSSLFLYFFRYGWNLLSHL